MDQKRRFLTALPYVVYPVNVGTSEIDIKETVLYKE